MEKSDITAHIKFNHNELDENDKKLLLAYVISIADDLSDVEASYTDDYTKMFIRTFNTIDNTEKMLHKMKQYIENIDILHIDMFAYVQGGTIKKQYSISDNNIVVTTETVTTTKEFL